MVGFQQRLFVAKGKASLAEVAKTGFPANGIGLAEEL